MDSVAACLDSSTSSCAWVLTVVRRITASGIHGFSKFLQFPAYRGIDNQVAGAHYHTADQGTIDFRAELDVALQALLEHCAQLRLGFRVEFEGGSHFDIHAA